MIYYSDIEFFFIAYISVIYLTWLLLQDNNINLNNYISQTFGYIVDTVLVQPIIKYIIYDEFYLINEEKQKETLNTIQKEEKFEDKYLKQFKDFSNEYIFSQEYKSNKLDELIDNWNTKHFKDIKILKDKLINVRNILDRGDVDGNDDIKKIIMFHNLDFNNDEEQDSDDEQETYNLNELFIQLLNKETEYVNELKDIEIKEINYDEIKKQANEFMINKYLENLINNYIIEYTPVGNVIMRYNHSKSSFEYFSNNTIPYRYLEPIGRKYVLTYNCKPLFIDLEEELKKVEQKEEQNKKIFTKLNRNIKEQPMKNRIQNNIILPPQMNVKIQENNNEKQLLKENANRYTWEGRLSSFNPLKKVDRRLVDKKYGLTYSDFKRIQLTQQNKK
jgi:hypothetical protein